MSSEIAISLAGVGKTYPLYQTRREIAWDLMFPHRDRSGSFEAVKPLTAEIGRGERVGIMGVNGSGKSTLLQMIAGTVSPTCGTVRVDGRIASLLELGSWINSSDTGRENVFTAGYAQGLSHDEISAKMDDIVAFAEIGDFIDQPVSTYSTGMLMRLAFATSIYQEADILLLDEIFAVGDARFAQKCIAYLRNYVTDKTVLLVSHDTNIVTMLCTRAILLDHGSVVADGSPRDITERYLALCYGEKQVVDAVPAPAPEEPAAVFGEGGVHLDRISLTGEDGAPVPAVKGGERVRLSVRIVAETDLEKPSVGFVVRSPEGVLLWGDSTLPGELGPVASGGVAEAKFAFPMPRLVNGIYTIGVAVSTGELDVHRVKVWNQSALRFSSVSNMPAGGALFGLPGASHEIREIR